MLFSSRKSISSIRAPVATNWDNSQPKIAGLISALTSSMDGSVLLCGRTEPITVHFRLVNAFARLRPMPRFAPVDAVSVSNVPRAKEVITDRQSILIFQPFFHRLVALRSQKTKDQNRYIAPEQYCMERTRPPKDTLSHGSCAAKMGAKFF